MLVKLKVRVTNLREENEYYPAKGKYTLSTLSILENELNVTGDIKVREELPFGAIYSIVINTSEPNSMIEAPSEREIAL